MATIEISPGQIDLKGPQRATSLDLRPYKAGSVVLAGLALTLVFAFTIPVSAGAMVLVGAAPTSALDLGSPTISNAAGSLVAQGYAPSLTTSAGTGIDLGVGSLVFKGPQRPVTSISIANPLGGLVLTGAAPLSIIDVILQPGVGNLLVSASAIALDEGGGTAHLPPVASLLWVGLPLDVRAGDLVITPAAGALVIKGPQRPAVVAQLPGPGDNPGAIVWHGLALDLTVSVPGSLVAFPPATLVLAGRAPDADPNKDIAIPVGSVVLSGKYVAVAFLQPAAGSLVWHGLAPSMAVSGSPILAMQVGRLVITGAALNVGRDYNPTLEVGSEVITGRVLTVAVTQSFSPFWAVGINRMAGGGWAL